MRKIIGILILSFLWLSNANAGVKEPGKINSLQCALGAMEAYQGAKEYREANPKKNTVVYMSCVGAKYNWNWRGHKNLETVHKKSFKECTKHSKKRDTGECFLFAINDEIVWELSEDKAKVLNQTLSKTLSKMKEHDEEKYASGSPPFFKFVNINDPAFVKYTEQKKLTYKNPKDDIPGRFLYDQEDVTDDYQVHAIYVLASDSKDKQYDVKGVIERIVLKGNKHFKNKTKEKQFRLDLTKDGKLDVSFLRLPITKKQLNKHEDGTVFIAAETVRNGFYHPKKLYTIFYQDAYKREWGQVGDAILETPTGKVEVVGGVTYLGSEMGTKDAMNPHLHELFHALGFVQLCAPKAVIEKNSRWGKNDHLSFTNDIMSDRDSGSKNIDIKRKQYYGHSNKDCPMDLRKSVFLEPTEKDAQLEPRTENCKMTRWVKIYNHQRSLDCRAKLDF